MKSYELRSMTFKNRLREIRLEYGMSVSELARRANISRQWLTKMELEGIVPNGKAMLLIAQALKTEASRIFYIEEGEEGKAMNGCS